MSVQEYQLDAVEAEAKTDFIVDASVLEEIVLLRLSSGNIRLLHLVQADDGIRFNVENVEMNTVSCILSWNRLNLTLFKGSTMDGSTAGQRSIGAICSLADLEQCSLGAGGSIAVAPPGQQGR
jgi:hypothetical protein